MRSSRGEPRTDSAAAAAADAAAAAAAAAADAADAAEQGWYQYLTAAMSNHRRFCRLGLLTVGREWQGRLPAAPVGPPTA